jgi:hypothetical protein
MRIASSNDVFFRSLNWLDQQLEARAAEALKQAQDLYTRGGSHGSAPDPASYRLHVVNACWGDRTLAFEGPYLDTLASAFGTGVRLVPPVRRAVMFRWSSRPGGKARRGRRLDVCNRGATQPTGMDRVGRRLASPAEARRGRAWEPSQGSQCDRPPKHGRNSDWRH